MGYVPVHNQNISRILFVRIQSFAIIYQMGNKPPSDGLDVGPTQPHIQWVPGSLTPGVRRPGRKADHSPPSSAEVKE